MNLDNSSSHLNTHQYQHRNSHRLENQHHRHTKTDKHTLVRAGFLSPTLHQSLLLWLSSISTSFHQTSLPAILCNSCDFHSALKMETVCFSEILASTNQCTWHQIPNHHHHCHCHETLKSHKHTTDINIYTCLKSW